MAVEWQQAGLPFSPFRDISLCRRLKSALQAGGSVFVAGSVVAGSARTGALVIGVLAIGAMRYLFAMAGWVLPWMRAQLPARYWRKVVTATAGIALVFAAAGIAAPEAAYSALGIALALLLESFGRDVWWLWRHRLGSSADATREARPARLSLP